MITIDDIHKLKERYVTDLYGEVRVEQETDKTYIDDTFNVGINPPHKVSRSGIGRRMVDAPAEQIVTSNLQFFVEMLRGKKESEERISKVVNQQWIPLIACQNPNPPKETVKNKLARGESYINPRHNESWVSNAIDKDEKGKPIFDKSGLPVHFPIPDPMVIYGSPEEDERGIPERVIVFYKRQPVDVIVNYPDWAKLHKAKYEGKDGKKTVEWLEYWDKDYKYFEADGEAVTKGIEPNLYGFVPFVRKFSGFGKRSPDGNLKHLIVSDIRFTRHLIYQECSLRSDIDSISHLFAHRTRNFVAPEGVDPETLKGKASYGAYDENIWPYGTTLMRDIEPTVPPEILQRHRDVVAEIAQRCPFIMAGFPTGSSGRQDDAAFIKALRRYDTVIENTQNEWATAIWMALKMGDGRVPTLRPKGLEKADVEGDFRCYVKLRAPDPVEEDRLITLGDRMRRQPNPAIDLETFHTQYCGYTLDESKKIQGKILADMVTIYNPDVATVMGMALAEEAGMEEWFRKAQERTAAMAQGKPLQERAPKTTEERIQGETETEAGREMGTQPQVGARTPPPRYYRGR